MRSFALLFAVAAACSTAFALAACTNAAGGTSGGGGGDDADGGAADGAPTSSSDGGVGSGLTPGAVPPSTFLFVSRVASDRDVLMAADTVSGETRVVTDLRGDGSEGWAIRGYALSPDRTRIVLASLYGPTKEDNDTKLATRRLWILAPDGSDFRRLTPVFENRSGGRSAYSIEIGEPIFSKDGSEILFGYGEYWYEGTTLQGGSGVWKVDANGGSLPSLVKAPNPCSLVDPSVDPSSGSVTLTHSVCVPGSMATGIYLYGEGVTGTPELLVQENATLQVSLETPRWVSDGSGFVFTGVLAVPDGNTTKQVRSLLFYDRATKKVSPLVVPQNADARVIDSAIAPDASAIVYCLEQGSARDLHLIDLSKEPATDTAITDDGKSCHPVW